MSKLGPKTDLVAVDQEVETKSPQNQVPVMRNADPSLLWLWYRPGVAAAAEMLALEPPTPTPRKLRVQT